MGIFASREYPTRRPISLIASFRRLWKTGQLKQDALDTWHRFARFGVGPALVYCLFCLVAFISYAFVAHVLPDYESPLSRAVLGAVGAFLLLNMTYNYVKAVTVNPGQPPEFDFSQPPGSEEKLDLAEGFRCCARCGLCKSPRSFHCVVCERCVLKMDHHSLWICNCVGFHNHRYFLLWLLYLGACCAFVIVVFFSTFFETVLLARRTHHSFFGRQCVSLSWLFAACILALSLCSGGVHAYFVFTNQTSIEFARNYDEAVRLRVEVAKNPFDLGGTRNFQQVFGPHDFWRFRWALSFLAKRPAGNGLQFPSLTEIVA